METWSWPSAKPDWPPVAALRRLAELRQSAAGRVARSLGEKDHLRKGRASSHANCGVCIAFSPDL
jgi:hypothetical protein